MNQIQKIREYVFDDANEFIIKNNVLTPKDGLWTLTISSSGRFDFLSSSCVGKYMYATSPSSGTVVFKFNDMAQPVRVAFDAVIFSGTVRLDSYNCKIPFPVLNEDRLEKSPLARIAAMTISNPGSIALKKLSIMTDMDD